MLLLFSSRGGAIGQEDTRSWTLGSGVQFEARVTKLNLAGIELEAPGGERRVFMLDDFGLRDRAYMKARLEVEAKSRPDSAILWPKRVELAVAPPVFTGGTDYRTEHFSFASARPVAPDLAMEVALIFESTLEAIKAMPLNLRPAPPEGMERFEARFTDRESFNAEIGREYQTIAGEEVKGIYFATKNYILFPFDSIETRPGSLEDDANRIDSNTLIHEVTHQVMHDWLRVLPYWLVEGFAEYVAMIPYQSGRFEFSEAEAGLKKVIRNRYEIKSGPIEIVHPADLLAVSNRNRWSNSTDEYLAAMMLTYFFIHLDSANTGAPMSAFFGETGRVRDETNEFTSDYNAAVSDYEVKRIVYDEKVREYNEAVMLKNAGQREGGGDAGGSYAKLKSSSGGRIKIGGKVSTLVPLVPPKPLEVPPILAQNTAPGSLDILKIAYAGALPKLLRGRDFDQLASEVEAAYQGAGFEVTFRPAKHQPAK